MDELGVENRSSIWLFSKIVVVLYFIGLLLLPIPVYSAPAMFTFVEFNIAFVLGLSLPILLMAVLIKPLVSANIIFPAVITFSVLALLYSASYLVTFQILASLSFATIFVAFLSTWPIFNQLKLEENETHSKKLLSQIYIINASALVYLLSLWFTPNLDAYWGWFLLNGVLLVIALGQVVFQKKLKLLPSFSLVHWGLAISFAGVMFAWLNAKTSLNVMVTFAVLHYLMAMVNGNWSLVQRIISAVPINKQLEQISQEDLFTFTHDPATNLPTQQQALISIKAKLAEQPYQKLAIIVFKPINFQQVNSILGHHNSDILLLQLAYCLQQKVVDESSLLVFEKNEQCTRIAKLPSLHFLVVLDLNQSKHSSKNLVDNLCNYLTQSVPEAMSFKSFSLNFELAFGIAEVKGNNQNLTEIISQATDALLLAENNQQAIHYYDQSRALFTERQLLSMERLKQDLISDSLYWYLQPQINLLDKNIKGFELMVHWYNGAGTPLELHEFVTIAEQSGDIYFLSKQMITQACEALAKLSRLGIYEKVSINLASKDLLETELVDFIEQQAIKYGVAPKYLMVELTEAVLLSAEHKAKKIIDQLRAIGVSLAIDNFSGSYESLRYLRKMSIDQVKVNCQWLSDNEENITEKAIVNALTNLARTMNLPLIGIGINSALIEQTFLGMGGLIGQGNSIKHGVVLDELEVWLSQWGKQYPNAKILSKK